MSGAAQLQDRYGLGLSTSSAGAATCYVEALDRQLSINAGADEGFEAAIALDDGFALAYAGLAFARFYRRSFEAAKEAAEQARARAGGLERRERQQIEAIAAFVNGQAGPALALLREHLAEFPRDALAAQTAVTLINSSGLVDRREESLAFIEGLAPAYGDDWWFLGSRAFAHHELDRYDEAREYAERALAAYPRSAAATHSLAHCFFETNDASGGAGFLDPWLSGYDRRGPFLSHLSWHLALFELQRGNERRVLELYSHSISPSVARGRTTLEDAAALLWRYQIYGCAPRELPWAEVSSYAAELTARPGMAFLDAHAALAYSGQGDEAALDRLIEGVAALAASGQALAAEVVLPLVRGLRAFGQGDYATTIRLIEPLDTQLVRLGGSHAQREVFEDTLLQAYLRSEHYEAAERLLRRRLKQRSSDRDLVWLEQAEAGARATVGGTGTTERAG